MARKSIETLVGELRTFLRIYNYRLDTGENSLNKSLILYPYSIGGKEVLDQVENIRDLHILSQNEGTEIDDFAGDLQKERVIGRYATINIVFFTSTTPTADITVPAGTQVRTAGTAFVSPVTFSTLSEATFAASAAENYYSYDRDRYEFPIAGIADDIGTVGNVGAGNVVQILSPITGIDGVTNLVASSGGEDEESDEDFKTRIALAQTGRDLNVVDGLRGYIQDQGFLDAFPVRVEDYDAERVTGVDVFVIDNSYATHTETFTYDPSRERYYFSLRPVVAVTSVQGSLTGILGVNEYDVNIDTTSEYRRSTQGLDYISFRQTSGLSVGEGVSVTYTYSEAIRQAQSNLELNPNKILTTDALVKRAYPLYFYLTATLSLTTNADGPATRNKARNAVVQLLSTYRLGGDIQKSDLVVVLQEGYGDYPIDTVDAVLISDYYLQDEFGTTYQPVDEVISVGNKQYVVYGRTVIV